MKRIISAIILISLLLLLLYRGSVFHFWLLYVVVIVLGLNEFYSLLIKAGINCFQWSGIGCGLIISYFFLQKWPVGIALVLVFVILLFRVFFCGEKFKYSVEGIGATFLGVFYVAYCLGYLFWLRSMKNGADMVMFCMVLLWANDTGAYYVGSNYGETKMAPVLSPGKTWEGFFGGFILSFAAAWIGADILLPAGGLKAALIMAGLVSIVGPVGDLAESLVKRSSAQKDSGNLIPGHGGLLDRIDSLLLTAPFIYVCCRFLL